MDHAQADTTDTALDPTDRAYAEMRNAYDFFNQELFGGSLPYCLITMQRSKAYRGYFAGDRFGEKEGGRLTDEIAMNPTCFKDRTTTETLSTLVHEMVHLWQHHFGEPSRRGYHNAEWAAKMREIGLIASHSGEPGGKETGQRVSHYIDVGGPFALACAELISRGAEISYVDVWADPAAKAKAESKTRYSCPLCKLRAWAKPDVRLICSDCRQPMLAKDAKPQQPKSSDEIWIIVDSNVETYATFAGHDDWTEAWLQRIYRIEVADGTAEARCNALYHLLLVNCVAFTNLAERGHEDAVRNVGRYLAESSARIMAAEEQQRKQPLAIDAVDAIEVADEVAS